MNDSLSLRFDASALMLDPIMRRAVAPLPVIEVPADLRDDVRAIAARGWEDRTRSEYIGVMVVRHFHGLLADLNAPSDLQEAALLMLVQEQQHARFCAEAARVLGGELEVAFDVEELCLERTEAPLAEQLWGMILGTYCCGEVVAHALIRHTLRALPPSSFRDVLRRIARDEVLHAHVGPTLLRAVRAQEHPRWLRYPGDAWVLGFVDAQRRAMAIRDVVEPDEAELFEDDAAAAQLVAVGIPPSMPFKHAYGRALASSVDRALRRAGVVIGGQPE